MACTRANLLSRGRTCHENALAIRRELADRYGEAQCLNMLGLVHLRLRELVAAEECFRGARTGFDELGLPYW
jgi:hypothetical protein